jgi:outer membrane protein
VRALNRAAVVLIVTLQAGCATSALDMAPRAPDTPWTPPTSSDGEIVAGKATAAGRLNNDSYVLPANAKVERNIPSPPAFNKSHDYSLAELVDIAQSTNPLTRIAWEDARSAALDAGIAEAFYLPFLSASAAGLYQSGHNTTTESGATSGNEGSVNGGGAFVFLQWLLFDFGARDAKTSAAKQASVIANISFTATHQEIIYNVSLAYYARAAAVEHASSSEQALHNAKEVQAAAEARFAHGLATSVEVAQARQATAQAQLAQVQALAQEHSAHRALVSAMGLSPLTEIKVADITHRKLSSALTEPIEQFVRESVARRPDVLSAYAAREASLQKLKAAQAEFMPKFWLAGVASYLSNGVSITSLPALGSQPPAINLGASHLGGTIMLGVTIPIYDGGLRRALEGQARAGVAKSDAKLEQVRDEATSQILSAGDNVTTSLSALDAAEVLTSAAQTTFDAALAAYRSGVGLITDVTQAQGALLAARDASTSAYSAALSSAAALALAAGMLGRTPQQ